MLISKVIFTFIFVYLHNYIFIIVSGEGNEKLDTNRPSSKEEIPGIEEKRGSIRKSMKHAWEGYRKYAFGKDELLPVTERWNNNWGVTLIDSLDTLYIMGMVEEFQEARDYLININFNQTIPGYHTSLFESVIRVLGGLLGAYDLSGEEIFLEKAKEVGDSLFLCFDHPSGVPYGFIDINK
ncbi:Mannosyl-oligosaccharide 1,2-alpha-mannosidase MNS1 [Smittium culicis]|uniref:alpha-1,2-Mannosidase n=1 Tax=Smittium culicis TaxID=133412 RepID=A0A1R1X9P3_9FUNG|nr:Mannosyl-oligosaccharide 1,2-alpha-mannosidase MNS1 [Smittium culicis]